MDEKLSLFHDYCFNAVYCAFPGENQDMEVEQIYSSKAARILWDMGCFLM